MFCQKVVLTNFTKFTGKHLCQSLIFNKVTGPLLFLGLSRVSQIKNISSKTCTNPLKIKKASYDTIFACQNLCTWYIQKNQVKNNIQSHDLLLFQQVFLIPLNAKNHILETWIWHFL